MTHTDRVTVSMPYYRCADTVARAVSSVLAQTHEDLAVVVVNDGDHDPGVWAPLEHLDDPRLIRFDLPVNRGRYYCDAVVLAATDTTWFTTHDADDHSDPDRLATLLGVADREDADVVFDGYVWHRPGKEDKVYRPDLRRGRSPVLGHWTQHTGLYRTTSLREAGGYHGGYRAGWDTLLTQLATHTCKVVVADRPMYHYTQRDGSLTTDPDTGLRSEYRKRVRTEYQAILTAAWRDPGRIPHLTRMRASLQAEVDADTARLRQALKERGLT